MRASGAPKEEVEVVAPDGGTDARRPGTQRRRENDTSYLRFKASFTERLLGSGHKTCRVLITLRRKLYKRASLILAYSFDNPAFTPVTPPNGDIKSLQKIISELQWKWTPLHHPLNESKWQEECT